jgi:hypothetical protein
VPSRRGDLLVGGDSQAQAGSFAGWGPQAIPRLYFGDASGSGAVVPSSTDSSRGRIIGLPQPNAPMNLSLTLKGNCAPVWADAWHLVREGIFAGDQNEARRVEAAVEGDAIYYRVTSTDASAPGMEGTLALTSPGRYVSYLTVDTPCGKVPVRLEATVVQNN